MSVSSAERRRRGLLGEHLAARFLELDGCSILARRARVADVEIDLLVREAGCLVVVEVKLRTTLAVPALDALRPRQVGRLRRAGCALLERHGWADAVRIDVVTIDWHVHEGRVEMCRLRGVDAA
jgi:putative endonuclease